MNQPNYFEDSMWNIDNSAPNTRPCVNADATTDESTEFSFFDHDHDHDDFMGSTHNPVIKNYMDISPDSMKQGEIMMESLPDYYWHYPNKKVKIDYGNDKLSRQNSLRQRPITRQSSARQAQTSQPALTDPTKEKSAVKTNDSLPKEADNCC